MYKKKKKTWGINVLWESCKPLLLVCSMKSPSSDVTQSVTLKSNFIQNIVFCGWIGLGSPSYFLSTCFHIFPHIQRQEQSQHSQGLELLTIFLLLYFLYGWSEKVSENLPDEVTAKNTNLRKHKKSYLI